MTTFAPLPASAPKVPSASPGPSIPSPATIARRGRRPALIPYSADLSPYISSTSSNPLFHISPFGTILGTTFSPPSSNATGKSPLLVLPPSLPDGSNPNTLQQPAWRGRGGGRGDISPFGWGSDEEESEEEFAMINKGGRKRAIANSNPGRKAQLRRSLLLGPIDMDAMEIDEDERREVEGDVFSWVNSSSPTDDGPMPLPNLASLKNLPTLSKNHLLPNRPRQLNLMGENGDAGMWTVPTSPMSGTFGADLELQQKRLEAAGLGIENVVSGSIGMEGVERA